MSRVRVRQSRSSSLVGMITGGIFVLIGVSTVVPMAGGFGLLWTLFALVITGMNAYNFFSDKGVAAWEIDSEESSVIDFDDRLRSLTKLKDDGLISEEEFAEKRKEIIEQKW